MAYRINKTDGTLLVDLLDGTIDIESSDITLIGRNYKGFGEIINENFVKMLENFASSSAPANPLRGQLWYDTSENRLKVYNGNEFISNNIILSGTQPNLAAGDIWIDSANEQLKFFDGSGEIMLAGPVYNKDQGKSGFEVNTLRDTTNTARTIIKLWAGNAAGATELLGVFSQSQFTPAVSFRIAQLVTGANPTGIIYPGFNSVSDVYKWRGLASRAETLADGVGVYRNADGFIRKDLPGTVETIQGSLAIQGIQGLQITSGQIAYGNTAAGLTGSTGTTIRSLLGGADVELQFADGTSAIFVDSSLDAVGINLPSGGSAASVPTAGFKLDVRGNTRIDGNLTITGEMTTVNVVDLTVDDKTIELASNNGTALLNDAGVSGGGIVLKSTGTDKTFTWVDATDAWTSSEHIDLAAGKSYKIGTNTVLSAGTLGPTITSSSLTSLGTLTSLNIDQLSLTGSANVGTLSGNLQLQAATNIISVQGSARITGLGTPTAPTDAATKSYVDATGVLSVMLDVTGLGTGSQLNDNIETLLNDMYPANGYNYSLGSNSGIAINIPVRQIGSLARVHTAAAGALTVTLNEAIINAAIDKTFTSVDKTITTNPLTVVSMVTGLDDPTLGTKVSLTTNLANPYEVGDQITISLSAGIVFNGTFAVTAVTNAFTFVIELSPSYNLTATPGASYSASSAQAERTFVLGQANTSVLKQFEFNNVVGTANATVTRYLKQFIVKLQGGVPVWKFDQELPPGVLI